MLALWVCKNYDIHHICCNICGIYISVLLLFYFTNYL